MTHRSPGPPDAALEGHLTDPADRTDPTANSDHPAHAGAPPPGAPSIAIWRRRALQLVTATAAYNGAEAALAISAGWRARSIALVGFGLDSIIELAAAVALLWRLRLEAGGASGEHVERAERRAQRLVGATFFLLAVYVTAQAGWSLWARAAPEESPLGIAIATLSLIVMPLIAWGKLRAADRLRSEALRAEAKETLACAYLSVTLLLGLVLNAALGWWRADPVAALLMVPWLVREGREALEGEEH